MKTISDIMASGFHQLPDGSWGKGMAATAKRRAQDATPSDLDCEKVAEGREHELHAQILDHCRAQRWIAFHSAMNHRTHGTLGTPDFILIADKGRVFFIEAKTAKGKLSREQAGLVFWANQLGTTIHVCRSFKEFLEIVK